MLKLLEMARDTSKYYGIRRAIKGVYYNKSIQLIEDIIASDAGAVENGDMGVINIANRISNLEPPIKCQDGSYLPLSNMRSQRELDSNDHVAIVRQLKKAMFDTGIIKCTSGQFERACMHLLTGSEATTDPDVHRSVVANGLLHSDPKTSLSVLIAFALIFKCKSVQELSDLFAFTYVDAYERAKQYGYVSYRFGGRIYQSRVMP